MGIFTWTDATIEKPRCNKWGDYPDSQVVMYGGYAKLICPDDSEIETEHHDYYGRIGGKDIYELVVDWNKEDLPKLLEGQNERVLHIAQMLHDGKSDEEITKYTHEVFDNYMKDDWKRNIGILIACNDDDAKKLRYPIKLTSHRDAHGYDSLYVSLSCQ